MKLRENDVPHLFLVLELKAPESIILETAGSNAKRLQLKWMSVQVK